MRVHVPSSQARVATGVFLSIAVVILCLPCAAQMSLSGAEAVQRIDWTALSIGSPIPDLMPAAESEDPTEAGFAGQWVERRSQTLTTYTSRQWKSFRSTADRRIIGRRQWTKNCDRS